MLLTSLENAGLMDKMDPVCVGAFSYLMLPIIQVGLDNLVIAHNEVIVAARCQNPPSLHRLFTPPARACQHKVSDIKGHPGSGGRCDRRAPPPRSGRVRAVLLTAPPPPCV